MVFLCGSSDGSILIALVLVKFFATRKWDGVTKPDILLIATSLYFCILWFRYKSIFKIPQNLAGGNHSNEGEIEPCFR
jgi:hypothetical protein